MVGVNIIKSVIKDLHKTDILYSFRNILKLSCFSFTFLLAINLRANKVIDVVIVGTC